MIEPYREGPVSNTARFAHGHVCGSSPPEASDQRCTSRARCACRPAEPKIEVPFKETSSSIYGSVVVLRMIPGPGAHREPIPHPIGERPTCQQSRSANLPLRRSHWICHPGVAISREKRCAPLHLTAFNKHEPKHYPCSFRIRFQRAARIMATHHQPASTLRNGGCRSQP